MTVDQATEQLLARGIRVLNAFMLADTELEHVERLLTLMDPPRGAVILDAGCGVGEVARIMREMRPDLTFKLLNTSQAQLEACPSDMLHVLGDFAKIPLSDESVDVVMFHYSLCHAHNWLRVLEEARRVLREGGTLFINDMARGGGSNYLMHELLNARAFTPRDIHEVAYRAGFELTEALMHKPAQQRLRDVFENQALYDVAFDNVFPVTVRYQRRTIADPVASAFARHGRIAFQFSGGRDSTAALYLLRPYWDRMTVYHLTTQDQFPEAQEVAAKVIADVNGAGGKVEILYTNVHKVREDHGMPSDVVPVDNTEIGRMVSGRPVKLQSRYECCARALMNPLQQRMKDDGITLIIRGQRDDEYASPPKRSGDTGDGFEVLYPIQTWSGDQVSQFLKDRGLPLAPFYEQGMKRAPECMGCTAWWDEGRAEYLRQHHPAQHVVLVKNMSVLRAEIARQLATDETTPQEHHHG